MRTSWKKSPENGATRNKLLWSLAALGAAGALAGLGTFAGFTTTTTPGDGPISTGEVILVNDGANTLTVAASLIVPGDTVERVVDLHNSGDQDLASLTLRITSIPTGTAVVDDPTRIMTLVVDRCPDPGAWVASGQVYACEDGGNLVPSVTVLNSEPLLGNHTFDVALNAEDAGGLDQLRFTITFPAWAGDNYQAETASLRYDFVGVQRPKTDK